MSTCIGHQQHQFAVVLDPYEKQVWSDVALPIAFVLAVKNVRMVFLWQTTFFLFQSIIGGIIYWLAPLSYTRLLSRLGKVDASITLLSLLQQFVAGSVLHIFMISQVLKPGVFLCCRSHVARFVKSVFS